MHGQYQGIVSNSFTTRPLNFYMSASPNNEVSTYIGSDNYIKIAITSASTYANFSGYVTLEYTKTID